MGICPICNGFESSETTCKQCQSVMEDKGRVIDYFDDYSPYMEIDGMKKIDGYEQTLQQHQCAHLLYCNHCQTEQVIFIQE
ncbi:hypothetical protein [Bacillus mesophilus]|uniref:Uncharacterized protein n=1 Tax=Bacillus mesophilus TaxID=1808955 RepID=A0A6M0Q364_9BACI|nr:hypothetical protein [Bacillus mesophilus]NEY70821.1 hypothetical protein [Bacillus mesophilus]